MFEMQRYVAVGADETRGLVFMLGANGVGGPMLLSVGPLYTPKADSRFLRSVLTLVSRANGSIVAGITLSIVMLTGFKGDMWVAEIGTGIQGSGERVRLPRPLAVRYGVGVLAGRGALMTGDTLQIEAEYD